MKNLSINQKVVMVVTGIILCLFSFVVFLRLTVYAPLNDALLEYIWRDPYTVARAFSVALMENEEDVLREVVVSEQLWRIDIWLTDHKAVHCDIPWDGGSVVGYVRPDERDRFTSYNIVTDLFCPRYSEGYYTLKVENITLENRGEVWPKWQVIDWEVCEQRNSEQSCSQVSHT